MKFQSCYSTEISWVEITDFEYFVYEVYNNQWGKGKQMN